MQRYRIWVRNFGSTVMPASCHSGSVAGQPLRRGTYASAMRRNLPVRFWIEAITASLGAALLALTLVSAEWFEELTGLEPDGGNGSLEWALPGFFLGISAPCALFAPPTG